MRNNPVKFANSNDSGKAKKFFKFVGIGALALFLAALTVLVINL
jgi:hypothetical protein